MSEALKTPETRDENSQEVTRQEDAATTATLLPPADVLEDTDGIKLWLDMPGVSSDRLNVTVDGQRLIVEGDMEIDMHEQMQSLYADIRATHYRRVFSLSGEQLDTDAIKAVLNDGVVGIEIPKKAELRPRKIEVQAG